MHVIKGVIVAFFILNTIYLTAQDDVLKTEEPSRGFFDVVIPFTVVENQKVSPLNWGGGLGLSYIKNNFSDRALFIGGELNYIFTGSDRITYNEDEYLRNSSSLLSLNMLFQYRPLRNRSFGVYPELSAGLLAPSFSSTFVYYDSGADEEMSNTEKIRMSVTAGICAGLGIRFFEYLNIKFRYQRSLPVNHFHPSQVYEVGTNIVYPYVKEPINRFEFIAGITLNRIR